MILALIQTLSLIVLLVVTLWGAVLIRQLTHASARKAAVSEAIAVIAAIGLKPSFEVRLIFFAPSIDAPISQPRGELAGLAIRSSPGNVNILRVRLRRVVWGENLPGSTLTFRDYDSAFRVPEGAGSVVVGGGEWRVFPFEPETTVPKSQGGLRFRTATLEIDWTIQNLTESFKEAKQAEIAFTDFNSDPRVGPYNLRWDALPGFGL